MASEPLQLRPMSIGDLLDATFRLYRRYFVLFIGIVAVIQIPLTLLEVTYEVTISPAERLQAVEDAGGRYRYWYDSPEEYDADALQLLLVRGFLMVVSFFAVQGLMNGVMARAVHDRYLGQPLGLVDTYRALGRHWLRLIGALVLLAILDLLILLLLFIPCLGWIASPILLIYVNVPILSLLAPVIVIEDQGAIDGLNRAFRLGRRSFWRVLGLNILLVLLTGIITFTVPFLFGVVLALWDPGFALQTVIVALLGLVLTVLVRPVWVCGLTLLYFDLRVRLEGFDLELMAQQMEADQPELPAAGPRAEQTYD